MNFLHYIAIIVFAGLGATVSDSTIFAAAKSVAQAPATETDGSDGKHEAKRKTPAQAPLVLTYLDRVRTWLQQKTMFGIRGMRQRFLDVRLERRFPHLASRVDFFELCDGLLDEYEDMQLLYSCQNLRWCTCTGIYGRIYLILQQLNDIVALKHNPATPFRHVEFGEAGCLQLYLFGYGLLKLGFKNLDFIAIGLYSDAFSQALKKDGDLNVYGKRLQKLLHLVSRDEKAEVNVSILCPENSESYLATIKATPARYRAHSYCLTDPGAHDQIPLYQSIIALTQPSRNVIVYTLGASETRGTRRDVTPILRQS